MLNYIYDHFIRYGHHKTGVLLAGKTGLKHDLILVSGISIPKIMIAGMSDSVWDCTLLALAPGNPGAPAVLGENRAHIHPVDLEEIKEFVKKHHWSIGYMWYNGAVVPRDLVEFYAK